MIIASDNEHLSSISLPTTSASPTFANRTIIPSVYSRTQHLYGKALTFSTQTALSAPFSSPSSPTPTITRPLCPCSTEPQPVVEKRTGILNYNNDYIKALLDLAARLEPIGANDWASLSEKCDNWAYKNDCLQSEGTSLKQKFDSLVNVKKLTGDLRYPKIVRYARHISRIILGRSSSIVAGENDDNSNGVGNGGTKSRCEFIGMSPKKHRKGVLGFKEKKEEGPLVKYDGQMSMVAWNLVKMRSTEKEEDEHKFIKLVTDLVTELFSRKLAELRSAVTEMKNIMSFVFKKLRERSAHGACKELQPNVILRTLVTQPLLKVIYWTCTCHTSSTQPTPSLSHV